MDLRGAWWRGAWLFSLVVLSLIMDSLASNLFSKHQSKHHSSKPHHHQHHHKSHQHLNNKTHFSFQDKSCQCRSELVDGTPVADLGVVAKYSWSEGTCHQLHHKCRLACTKFLNLHGYLPSTTSTTLGYHYCDLYGRVTSNAGVEVRVVWETTNCHQKKFQKSKKSSKLCCGHTYIPINSNDKHVTAKVFGWNPDCKAQTFVVAS